MKVITGTTEQTVLRAQDYLDSFGAGSTVAVFYNEDTARLNFEGKNVVSITECDGLVRSRLDYGMSPEQYNGQPIDLSVLGLGSDGQIGFNEVGAAFSSSARRQKLTETTKSDLAFLGELPDFGFTLGISEILSSRAAMVLCLGEEKADALYQMLYARPDSTVPAAFLQMLPDVVVYADNAAASKL